MKKVIVLGSSGSIGKSTLDVIRRFPDKFKVTALCVHSSIDLLAEQVKEFKPQTVAVGTEALAAKLKTLISNDIEILIGEEGYKQIARECDYDIYVGAMVGFAGLFPTVEAVKRGKRIALANKETLVVAGELITKLCKEHNAELIPIDSEHSALFQCMIGEKLSEVSKFLITASGGPFLNYTSEQLENVSIAEALNHPTWRMGSKITIDSATLMNKGLEVIEAHWLFNFPLSKIEVVVHPNSIIHSMIEFIDGSIKAQLSVPDMRIPIQYALSYPERLPASYVTTHFPSLSDLTFRAPQIENFECLKLAFEALSEGGTAPCILNAANEIAVARFLKGEVKFKKIPYIIGQTLNAIEKKFNPTLEDLISCDKTTRGYAAKII